MRKSLLVVLIIILGISGIAVKHSGNFHNFAVQVAYAEEDEGENENEDDEEREDEGDDDESKDYEETEDASPSALPERGQPIITYEVVYEPGYDRDSDKDGLVDALDPNPTIHQKLVFTDSDGDTVADAFDNYPGDDDFFFTQDTDYNQNGILDSYEQ